MTALSQDRITEMQHALQQRMMIGAATPGETNKDVTVLTAEAEFPAMIIDVSNKLFAASVFTTFGEPVYTYVADNNETPHQFVIPVGDFRNVDPVA